MNQSDIAEQAEKLALPEAVNPYVEIAESQAPQPDIEAISARRKRKLYRSWNGRLFVKGGLSAMSTPRLNNCKECGSDYSDKHECEGVAAPLEPTPRETFTLRGRNFAEWAYVVAHPSKLLDLGFKSVQQFLRELCEAYARLWSQRTSKKNWRG